MAHDGLGELQAARKQEGILAMKMGIIVAGLALSLLANPAQAAEWTHNGVTVDCPWAEATQNGVAPVYMEIRADAQADQRLMSAFSDAAESAEISSYTRVAGVLRRQRIEYLPVAAGQAVQLIPGGYHVLLVGLKEALVAGTTFGAWVEFEPAGGFAIEVLVVRPGAGAPCGAASAPLISPPSGGAPRPPAVRVLPVPPPIYVVPRGSF
jgi:periplasmic copper chaperone A